MVRSGKSPPRTSTSSKRLLPSTSDSPLHEGKKPKTFTSPNRFTVIASIDTSCDDSIFDADPVFHDDTVVLPPHP